MWNCMSVPKILGFPCLIQFFHGKPQNSCTSFSAGIEWCVMQYCIWEVYLSITQKSCILPSLRLSTIPSLYDRFYKGSCSNKHAWIISNTPVSMFNWMEYCRDPLRSWRMLHHNNAVWMLFCDSWLWRRLQVRLVCGIYQNANII